jgi:hypothetical protein
VSARAAKSWRAGLAAPTLLLLALCSAPACGDGCKSNEQTEAAGGGAPAVEKAEPAQPPAPATAVIEGVVRMAAGAEPPSYPQESMERRVLQHTEHAALPTTCTPPKTTDRQPVQVTPDGLLTNVVVAASDFKQQPRHAPVIRDVTISDCRLTPAMVAATKGDTLRVRNELDYPFMPAYGATEVVKTLIKGQSYEAKLDKPGVSPLLCGFTAPCGRTDVVVMLHPLHAVTDAQGKFRIDDFPAGETVKLSAWHPLFQESAVEVRAEPGEVKRVELTLTPLAAPAPEPAPAEPNKAPKAAGAPKREPAAAPQ